ncbi:TonB-dependent receptor [Leptolyngbya sp. CCNP1308]|uniref:TonB-dependent receptor n=1 Tax=Leptolyngbya sp. CCNP1308 TaxID=3110255 RepID=UPI002B2082D5|nr:TonB-dependent receptor [Leptolyngbya sp. CCNP1308]
MLALGNAGLLLGSLTPLAMAQAAFEPAAAADISVEAPAVPVAEPLTPAIAQPSPLPMDSVAPSTSSANEAVDLVAPSASETSETSETLAPASQPAAAEAATSTTETSEPATQAAIRFLTPTPEAVLDIPSTTVTLQFPVGSEITLVVNGSPVGDDLIGRTETNLETGLITQTWYGVGLHSGENQLSAQGQLGGAALTQADLTIQVRGAIASLSVTTLESRVAADGRSTVTVQGQLLDDQGNVASQDTVITLESSQGQFVEDDQNSDQPGFQVQTQGGSFSTTLQTGLTPGQTTIRASRGDLEAYTQVEFTTELRPTLLTGVVDVRLGSGGTDFYSRYRDFLPADGGAGTQLAIRGGAFAITSFGDWRFTGAYRSDRALNEGCDGTVPLFRNYQDCDRPYPVYGDDSTSEVLAPSTDSLYLRLERTSPTPNAGSDYVMWGDYRTDEFATSSQLYSSISRSLHGFSGNYNLGNLQLSAIYGNNIQGFQRDTIAPDGTSGFYFLSRRLLLPGSEAIYFELEELNRPGQVLDRQPLSRGPDYEIDYDRGTVLFRQPVLRTAVDGQGRTLVRRIVATYQHEGGGSTSLYGGRLRYHLNRDPAQASWLGATYLQENHADQQFQLYGADAQINFGSGGLLLAEYAHSTSSLINTNPVAGEAYRLEVSNAFSDQLSARAYWQQVSPGFTNNATTSFVPGQRRYGAELQADLSETTTLRFGYDHEDNYGVAPATLTALEPLLFPGVAAAPGQPLDNSLTTITAGIQQRIGSATTSLDWIHRDRSDRLNPQFSTVTNQIRSMATLPVTENVTFTALNEFTLAGQADAVYPNRTLLGLNWQIQPGISLGVTHQILNGGQFDNDSLTSLYLSGDYEFGTGTRLTGNFSLFDRGQMSGSVGIQQGVTLAPGLQLDLAYEYVFQSNNLVTGAGTQFAQPYAVGQSAAALAPTGGSSYSVGLSYTGSPDFQTNLRFEHRTSGAASNTVISADAQGRLSPSLTVLGRFQQASAANQLLSGLGDTTNLRLGLAYRNPDNDVFNALLRYEYRRNPGLLPESLLENSGSGSADHVFAAEAIYAPNWQWEFYGKFALRSSTSYLASDLVGSSTVTLAQLRATYRLNYQWDLVGEARWINQPGAGYSETGFSLETGYYLNPNLRLSAGYSFGGVYDRDFNGSRSAGGPYFGLTIKLDNSLLEGFSIDDDPSIQAGPEAAPLEPMSNSEPTPSHHQPRSLEEAI